MTLAQAESLLKRITYLPGSFFEIHLNPYGGISIRLSVERLDSRNTKDRILVCVDEFFPEETFRAIDPELFINLVKNVASRAEQHEVKEWLKLDGKHLEDPHP